MNRNFSYYTITSTDDHYGLVGQFETRSDALDHINASYHGALEQGYDNRHNEWLIVKNENTKIYNDEGHFRSEETRRYVVGYAKFSEKYECYTLCDWA